MIVRAAIVVALVLAFSPAAATATPPTIRVSATTRSGPAPLRVVFTATGDGVSYHWDFGDGSAAEGASVDHVYGAGAFTARVTATGAGGRRRSEERRVGKECRWWWWRDH